MIDLYTVTISVLGFFAVLLALFVYWNKHVESNITSEQPATYNMYYAGVEYIGEYGKPYIDITDDGRCYIRMWKNGRYYVCECGRCKVYVGMVDESGRFSLVEYQGSW
jgi:hypothetical protein